MALPSDIPNLPSQILNERFHLALPSLPNWIEPCAEYLRQRSVLGGACSESRSGKLLVALHEALANAVIHGNLGVSSELKERGDASFAQALAQRSSDPVYSERIVEIEFVYDGQTCRWTITDEGQGFDVQRVLERCLSDDPEVLLASGRGILMMRSFMDDVRYEMGGRRLVLTMSRESGMERRVAPRMQKKEPLRIVPVRPDGTADWSAAYDGLTRNVSEHGIGIFQDHLIQTDKILIGIQVGGSLVYVPAQVRHCKNVGTNLVDLGCSFLVPPPGEASQGPAADDEETRRLHEAIESILYARPALPHDERRVYPRVVYNERVEISPAVAGNSVMGFARDLSKGGMSVITTAPVPLESVRVALSRDDRDPLRVRGKAVRCDRIQDNFYDVGVRFLGLEDR